MYARGLRFCLRRSVLVATVLFACFCGSLGLFPRIGTEFLPKADEGDLRITGTMAAGIQLDQMDTQTSQIENAIFKSVKEARTTAVNMGDDADNADRWNECWVRVHLQPRSRRKRNSEQIRRELAKEIGPVAGMKVRVQVSSEQVLTRMLSATRVRGDLTVEVRGYDLDTAEQLAEAVMKRMRAIPGLVNVQAGNSERRPELGAHIDRLKAGQLGVSVQNITQTLETTVRGTEATLFREDGNEFRVMVRLREDDRNRVDDIEHVGITARRGSAAPIVQTPGVYQTPGVLPAAINSQGTIIPLKSVVDFGRDRSPVTIARLDQQRVIQISADVADRDLGSVVADMQSEFDRMRLPPGFTLNISGQWEEQQKAFADLKLGFVLAVILMYMVMASQFESLKDPLIILVTLPLGAIGVLTTMVLTNTTLNVQSFIGLVVLSGIVVNNAIVLLDYANQLRHEHPELSAVDVVVRAGVRRFRPILMTTLTTVLAMIPVALGWGEGGELQAPMARVVIGGLMSGTVLTLVVIPLIYCAIDRRRAAA